LRRFRCYPDFLRTKQEAAAAVSRPLSGIRVLELGNLLAGPFCGMLLGDMGADVIKIEPRRSGDMIRSTQPHIEGESANYIAINRNKRSIAIDLKPRAAG
jgi:formyl-CoA transferase